MTIGTFPPLDDQQLILLCLLVGFVVFIGLELWLKKRRRRAGGKRWFEPRASDAARVPDAADQLRIVMGADFTIQPLLNKGETRLYRELDRLVSERNPEWRVMAQVSLGEILRSRDAEAYRCINAKRVDLLLVDADCRPRHVVEYQGSGHHQGTAAARDAIKKEALRRAGIGYHEVLAGHTTPSDLKRLIERLMERAAGPWHASAGDGERPVEERPF
ncbi:DUF2726 domain-containing protein [Tianweitania sp. BSSL-BM11]|uniref:DUF2726 domain-containing protein n=1 Tax=Tianweitania aestuarii TaxID=2814886 RepID=A0ABS5RSI1_9HYPH|nr:DUF2726 domain-containing protein [Tianweitania aestuarii]MBS9719189.1 DUF2726 domain-containing protein [Tianweitania aestuarii]